MVARADRLKETVKQEMKESMKDVMIQTQKRLDDNGSKIMISDTDLNKMSVVEQQKAFGFICLLPNTVRVSSRDVNMDKCEGTIKNSLNKNDNTFLVRKEWYNKHQEITGKKRERPQNLNDYNPSPKKTKETNVTTAEKLSFKHHDCDKNVEVMLPSTYQIEVNKKFNNTRIREIQRSWNPIWFTNDKIKSVRGEPLNTQVKCANPNKFIIPDGSPNTSKEDGTATLLKKRFNCTTGHVVVNIHLKYSDNYTSEISEYVNHLIKVGLRSKKYYLSNINYQCQDWYSKPYPEYVKYLAKVHRQLDKALLVNWIYNPNYCIAPDCYLNEWNKQKKRIPYVLDLKDPIAIMGGGYEPIVKKKHKMNKFEKFQAYVDIMETFGFDKFCCVVVCWCCVYVVLLCCCLVVLFVCQFIFGRAKYDEGFGNKLYIWKLFFNGYWQISIV